MMVVVTSQGTQLIRRGSIQEWKDLTLWIHATLPQFLGDNIMYADMDQIGGALVTVSVFLNDRPVYKTTLPDNQEVQSPLIGFWTYGKHWALELKDNVVIDGQPVNRSQGYQKSYEFHLLGGKPLYFFEKDGEVDLNYAEQEIALDGFLIPHGNCCSSAEINPRQRGDLLVFFLNKNQQWYYVEIEFESAPALQISQQAVWGKGAISASQFSPDGQRLGVVTTQGIYIYDAASLAQLDFIPNAAAFPAVAFSPDWSLLAVGNGSSISLLRLADRAKVAHLETDQGK